MGLSGEVVWALMLLCGLQWHALDRTEQAKYYEMAREERAKHMQVRKLEGCVWKWLDSRAIYVCADVSGLECKRQLRHTQEAPKEKGEAG